MILQNSKRVEYLVYGFYLFLGNWVIYQFDAENILNHKILTTLLWKRTVNVYMFNFKKKVNRITGSYFIKMRTTVLS